MAQSKELVALRDNNDMATLDILEEILSLSAKDRSKGIAMMKEHKFTSTDGSEAQASIVDKILAAEDDDELENIGAAISWQDFLGVPMYINGFRPLPSEKEGDGPPFYLMVNVQNVVSGDTLDLSIGSWGVLAQLINLAKRNKIPGAVRILTKGEETKAGRNPLRLVSTSHEKDARLAAKAKERL